MSNGCKAELGFQKYTSRAYELGMVYRRRVLRSAKAGTIKWIFSELLTKKHNAICYIHIGKMSHKNIIDESIILLNWEIEKATFPLFTDY